MAGNITKFYVANIPEGCRPWDLATFLGNHGEIAGSFIARERNKEGLKFGFMSFKGDRGWKEMERSMQGLKLGGFKLTINRAKFAIENEAVEEPRIHSVKPLHKGKATEEIRNNQTDAFFRNGCSYSSVLMNKTGPSSS
ncbi:putative RNA recognition motif domain, nucleotide-binding alpha-beta plait domain superfamily [Helianthus annuus]|nr:putative RNA recognition motif domain, nucleotide-binding alpha-beta plait domain superfamily [Helianthus annuus]KAJ0675006.1 putative RNA recognition motif domain, nucleotide-binding alpha-beta plait domain superfamily [Helianthus annuus]KAJ0866561.1 putative RNA recognition motif domain, nucleotide-binding alpha-beta plait domain superfamily [Helianthus annuus]